MSFPCAFTWKECQHKNTCLPSGLWKAFLTTHTCTEQGSSEKKFSTAFCFNCLASLASSNQHTRCSGSLEQSQREDFYFLDLTCPSLPMHTTDVPSYVIFKEGDLTKWKICRFLFSLSQTCVTSFLEWETTWIEIFIIHQLYFIVILIKQTNNKHLLIWILFSISSQARNKNIQQLRKPHVYFIQW